MISYLKRNLAEITNSRPLQYFGVALFFSHVVTAYFWYANDFSHREPLCWSVLPQCKMWGPALQNYAQPVVVIYGLLALTGIVLFLLKKIPAAYYLFFALSIFKLTFHLSDYRMMGNYHYMSHIVNFIFLLALNKTNTIKMFMVLFYFSAGLIKFNTDWLSGAAMLREPLIKGKLLEVACAYVILLELAGSFLLLSKNKWLRYFFLFQFVCFHIFSWHIVGYFYPLILFSFLTIFLLDRRNFTLPQQPFNLGAAAVLLAAQIYPLVMEPQSSLNGHGRILSLNMLDARSVCETHFILNYKNKVIEYTPTFPGYGVRIHCDPVLVLEQIDKTCQSQKDSAAFVDMDVDHQTRRASSFDVIEQFTFKNVCTHPLRIGFLGKVYQNEKD